MMHNSKIITNAVHQVDLLLHANLSLLSGDGASKLLFITRKIVDGQEMIVINDLISDSWGKEIHFYISKEAGPTAGRLFFKFNGYHLEIWNESYATTMERFDLSRAQAVRFVQMFGMPERIESLCFEIEPVDATISQIEALVIHKRLEKIESLLTKQAFS